MARFSKKMMAGIVTGAILVLGSIGVYSLQETQTEQRAEAARTEQYGRGERPPYQRMNSAAAAKQVADTFGVSESEVKKAIDDDTDFRDIGQAAMLAKLSKKSFADVLAMKTDSNKWADVRESLGITREAVRDAMDDMTAVHLARHSGIDQETAVTLLRDGYRPWDIEAAAAIAKASGKDIQTVLDAKKINNRWSEVAEQFGVSRDALRSARERSGMPGAPHMGMPGAPEPMMDGDDWECPASAPANPPANMPCN